MKIRDINSKIKVIFFSKFTDHA